MNEGDMKTTPDMLREAADVFEQKNKEYGNTYMIHGPVMVQLFKDSLLTLITEDDYARFAILEKIVDKIIRYSRNFEKGGHDDSLLDISVYCNILRELDYTLEKKKIMEAPVSE